MKYTVVLTADYPAVARDLLAGQFDVVAHPTEHQRSEEEVITLLEEADAAITLPSDPLTRRVLEANPNLRMIANYAAGCDNVDVDAARELGIVVTNTPGVLTGVLSEATATEETRAAMARIAATDVHRFLNGQPPLHTVT